MKAIAFIGQAMAPIAFIALIALIAWAVVTVN